MLSVRVYGPTDKESDQGRIVQFIKSWPFKYSKLIYKMAKDFLDIKYLHIAHWKYKRDIFTPFTTDYKDNSLYMS